MDFFLLCFLQNCSSFSHYIFQSQNFIQEFLSWSFKWYLLSTEFVQLFYSFSLLWTSCFQQHFCSCLACGFVYNLSKKVLKLHETVRNQILSLNDNNDNGTMTEISCFTSRLWQCAAKDNAWHSGQMSPFCGILHKCNRTRLWFCLTFATKSWRLYFSKIKFS